MRKALFVLIGCLSGGGAMQALQAQDAHFLAIRVFVPTGLPTNVVPVLASIDWHSAQRVWGKKPSAGLLKAWETTSGRPRPVLAQMNVIANQHMQLALLLPAEPAGERLIRIFPEAALAPSQFPQLKVASDAGIITIFNETYAIAHNSARNGGLPSRIVFPQTGKIFETFVFNDRVYSKQEGQGSYRLCEDKSPTIFLTASGPLYAEVHVQARYLQGDREPYSRPHAHYVYSYFAGLPLVRIAGEITQQESFAWNELHFFELHFKDDSFRHWAHSESEGLQTFCDDSKGYFSPSWGLLSDGKNVIGLLGAARIYDGKNDYGRYLHGPWIAWDSLTQQFALDVWIGTADDAISTIQQAAARKLSVLTGTVYSPQLLSQMAEIQRRSQKQPLLAWQLSLLESALRQQQISLPEAEKVAAMILAANAAKNNQFLQLGPNKLYLMSASRLAVAFSVPQNQLISLYDLHYRRELLAAPALFFRLTLRNTAGRTLTLDSTDFVLKQPAILESPVASRVQAPRRPPVWQFVSRKDDIGGLIVAMQPQLLDNQLQWALSINNTQEDWTLINVTAPVLQAAPLENMADDVVLLPNGFGRAYPILACPSYNARYPSHSACMQFMAVTDNTSGLYVGYHDPTASTKQLHCDPSASASGGGVGLRFEVPAPNATVMGNDFSMPGRFVLAAVEGGYFPACWFYRQWLEKQAPWWPEPGRFSRSDYPRWLTQIQTWVCWGAGEASKTVEPTKAFAAAMGTPTALHWYNWHVIPFDNDYPHYFPAKPGFREGVRELQQAGVRVMPYINGRLWDTDTESFKTEAYRYATKQEDGTPYIEIYGSKEKLAPMCIHTRFWQEKVQEIVMRLVAEEGVDGVYIDQVAAAAPVLCYDKSHGHPLAGGHWWAEGYWKMLGELQEKIARVHPDKMLTTESNAEPFAKFFDAYLMCNSNSDYEVPLFPAVYGGKILMFGTYMDNKDWDDLTLMALRQGKLFAFGAQLWWSNPTIVHNASATKWLRDLAHLRQRVNEFFVQGQMAPPPVFAEPIGMLTTEWRSWGPSKIQIHTPDLWATMWRLQDGRLMMPLVNLPKQERVMTWQFNPMRYGLKPSAKIRIERIGASGVIETFVKQGTFSLPLKLGPAEATALLLIPQ